MIEFSLYKKDLEYFNNILSKSNNLRFSISNGLISSFFEANLFKPHMYAGDMDQKNYFNDFEYDFAFSVHEKHIDLFDKLFKKFGKLNNKFDKIAYSYPELFGLFNNLDKIKNYGGCDILIEKEHHELYKNDFIRYTISFSGNLLVVLETITRIKRVLDIINEIYYFDDDNNLKSDKLLINYIYSLDKDKSKDIFVLDYEIMYNIDGDLKFHYKCAELEINGVNIKYNNIFITNGKDLVPNKMFNLKSIMSNLDNN